MQEEQDPDQWGIFLTLDMLRTRLEKIGNVIFEHGDIHTGLPAKQKRGTLATGVFIRDTIHTYKLLTRSKFWAI